MNTLKKIAKVLGIVVALVVVVAGALYLIYLRPVMEKMKKTELVQIDSAFQVVLGGGGNSGIITSDSLVIVVDTKMGDAAQALYEQVKAIAGNKPILVVNTHWHKDHCAGNKFYKDQTIVAGGNYTQEEWIKEAGEETLPTVWLKDQMVINMGKEKVLLLNVGPAHTPSDVIVVLEQRHVLFGGDLVLNKQAPALLGKANPQAYMDLLGQADYTHAKTVVPGHGPMGGMEIVENFLQFFRDMKLAAEDPSKEDSLVAKYDDWTQVPFVMSPKAAVSAFKKLKK